MALIVMTAMSVAACATAGNNATPTSGSAAGAGINGGRGGWDCPGGVCDWRASDAVAAARSRYASGESGVPASSGPAPGLADQKVLGLDAISIIDDNADRAAYLRYVEAFDPAAKVRAIPMQRSRVLTVKDNAGRRVLGAEIAITDANGVTVAQLRTYADGRALFRPPLTPAGSVAPTYRATVRSPAGSPSRAVELPADGSDVELQVDGIVATSGPMQVDVLFLLDASGSMPAEIDRLKATMARITSDLSRLPSQPNVRFGLTVYRDKSDLFVTRSFDLTPDPAAFAAALQQVQAGGGGDTPEDLEAGLHDALAKPAWGGTDAIKLVFLIGDASPHVDYPNAVPYSFSVDGAAAQGIKIIPIVASGLDETGFYVFRQLAVVTMGRVISTTVDVSAGTVLPLDDLVVRAVTQEVETRSG